MDNHTFAISSLVRGLDALAPSDVLLSDVSVLHFTGICFNESQDLSSSLVRFLSRGSTAERIRLWVLFTCHESTKQRHGSSEASYRELCDTDLAATLELPGGLQLSPSATENDASTLEYLSPLPVQSVDKDNTSIVGSPGQPPSPAADNFTAPNLGLSPRASSVIATESATPNTSLWLSSTAGLGTGHSPSSLSSINSLDTTRSYSPFSQAAAQFYYNALPLKYHKRVPDLVVASGFVETFDLRWLKNVNLWSTTMKLPSVKEDQSRIQRLYQTYDSFWKLDKHLKCAVRLCSLFLSQSVEDTLATVPDDINGQYKFKAAYQRMANDAGIPVDKIKRDVRLSRQYMFLLKECGPGDLLDLDDKIATG